MIVDLDRYCFWPVGEAVNTPAFHAGIQGFESPTGHHGRLAQLGEHLPYKQGVGGSSPSPSTTSDSILSH